MNLKWYIECNWSILLIVDSIFTIKCTLINVNKVFEMCLNECCYSFFLFPSVKLKETETREKAVIEGIWGRFVKDSLLCSLLSSSLFCDSLISSSVTSWGAPRVCPNSWLTSLAFCWAFSTALAQTHRLEAQTHRLVKLAFIKRIKSKMAVIIPGAFTWADRGIWGCGRNAAFPQWRSCPVSPEELYTPVPSSQSRRKSQLPVRTTKHKVNLVFRKVMSCSLVKYNVTSASMWYRSASLWRNFLTNMSLLLTPCCLGIIQ